VNYMSSYKIIIVPCENFEENTWQKCFLMV
jgi:hypothetical protein